MKNKIYSLILVLVATMIISSCDKSFLETYPTDAVSAAAVNSTTDNAWAALNGIHRAIYVRYRMQGAGGLGGHYIVTDCQGEDQVQNANQWYNEVYRWTGPRSATNRYCDYPWRMFYQWIGNANVLINGVDEAVGPQAEKNAIKGEALFLRAFSHHRLVQAYADRYVPGGPNTQLGIPLMLESTTEGQPRATVAAVYAQIHQDLDDAITLLAGFNRPDKSHINADVATAIKARVYLTEGNYTQASALATSVINSPNGWELMDAATLADGFRDGSGEDDEFLWVSHIIPDQTDVWANYGAYMSRNFSSSAIRGNPRSISQWLYEQISATDVRKGLYDDAVGDALTLPAGITLLSTHKRFPYTNEKFIAPSNGDSRVDVPHVRIAEMHLIVAESQARLGNDGPAAAALYNLAFARDPAYTLSANTGQALIDEIMVQRRVELWGEGFRWYDLKRLNQDLDRNAALSHDPALANEMFIPAGDVKWTWLIPQDEMDANPAMIQNPLF